MKLSMKFIRLTFAIVISLMFGLQIAHAADKPKTNAATTTTSESSNKDNATSNDMNQKMYQFCWNELATNNVQASKDFYGNVFGWKFTEHAVGDMTYTMAKTNDKDFAGIWAIPKDQESQIPPHWLAYICVEDLEKSLDKAVKYGATIIKPISQAGEYGRFAVIKDPTGAHLALWHTTMNSNNKTSSNVNVKTSNNNK